MASMAPKADEILNAATGLIQKRGYNGFSFRDIASEVGIRSASIHYHFPTKTDLTTAVITAYRQSFAVGLTNIDQNNSNALDRLKAFGDIFLSTLNIHNNVCLCGMLAGEAETLPEEVRSEVGKFFDEQCDWLSAVIQDGQTEGTVRCQIDSHIFAVSFLSSLEGAMILARSMQKSEILSNTISLQLQALAKMG